VCALAAACTLGVRASSQIQAEDAAIQLQIGTVLVGEMRYREALDAFDRAIRADDAALVVRARKEKIRAALRIAEFDLARSEGEALTAGDNPDAEARTLYADALWARGLFDEADTEYRRAEQLAPGSSRVRFGLARSLATRSQLDDALNETLAAAGESPRDPEIHALLGHIYERLGRFDDAADSYARYVELLPAGFESSASVFNAKVQLLRSFKGREPYVIEGRDTTFRVPFKLINNKILLQGRLNNVNVEFVLDTGSERTGFTFETARRAGVVPVTSTLTAGVGVSSVRALALGRAERIEVGRLRIRNIPVSIRNPALRIMPRWQSESFSPLAMGLSVVVDYHRREVVLGREIPDSGADIRLPMRVNRLPLVRGMLNSRHPAYFVVDTGGELISISADTANGLAMPPPPRRIPLRVYGMSGWDADAYLLPGVDVNFDAIEYRKLGLAVLNLRAPSILLGFQLGGIVGHKFLGGYRVSMDMERSELRLEKF
jgi:Flp pilus assembly protein TadD